MMITNAKYIDEEQLRDIPLERPKNAGRVWKGVPHYEFINGVRTEVESRGWKVDGSCFHVTPDGTGMGGVYQLTIPRVEAPEGLAFNVGFVHSNARKRAMSLVIGATVFICSNGMVFGEIVMNRKHTTNAVLSDLLEEAFDVYLDRTALAQKTVQSLRERELSQREVDSILLRAGREKILPWSRIGQLDEEFRHPSFGEFKDPTSFNLLQACTHIIKKSPPLEQMDIANNFREILPSLN